ncbi:hypothetical protein H4582DRAFT_848470 [Lactarius indigo]|nr:hypothetical protein H4582DRAFT_848470 [Lactarius indigo]
MAEQVEKAFQKQPLFQNAKARGGKKVSTKEKRWYKDVGLGFKTPPEAINGSYIDKKCPFTSEVSIRGRILTGRVVSTKDDPYHYHSPRLPPLRSQIHGTKTSQRTYRLRSVWSSVMWSLSVSADRYQKRCGSTFYGLQRTRLRRRRLASFRIHMEM